jgi:hypothetical protein
MWCVVDGGGVVWGGGGDYFGVFCMNLRQSRLSIFKVCILLREYNQYVPIQPSTQQLFINT